mmetsp:Transcript_11525/g.18812  ORF Transcript_11525/g.18812 Transcript_11525/m.18812 type:complete len:309 (-) Transcript_11525:258-1184(-)|eukprot:CAMPEP_0114435508 /NCGR_PEP_ID=MMETSP0103-20121206/12881_1 /TAXON_ID=37642 ORGANISM="Paraphysomonas imperforata, Strain PA2" /NCGR_SAMPLE_ID=MMETSP0103 /ASSEMBLY_ACC=CAM_ASM_000201 /LENGTH=308 /DNA_ID=CAMNT_0001605565 /DNA_START=99 /DNA_END=1025 /DNA_ORIENTATION=-
MSENFDYKKKVKNTILHKIKADAAVGHLYPSNEKYITQRVEEFVSSEDIPSRPEARDQFNQSLRRELHETAAQGKTRKKVTYKVLPSEVPDDAPPFVPREIKQHPQDIVDFMYQKQEESRENYRKERQLAHEKATNGSLNEYIPPPSLYSPPVQHYDKNRPYFQEYIRYRNELRPVVMPVFTETKGSIRDRAKATFMPKKDPNFVSKRDKKFADRVKKSQAEEKECEDIKKYRRLKKQRESQRLMELQRSVLTSPIKSSRPSTSFNSSRSPAPSARPGTCNSFSPAALTSAYDRPDYPTAGTIWITDV